MRKKYADETYLRGVTQYHVVTKELKKQNAYIVLKKIIEIDKPFVKNFTLIDNGYYIILWNIHLWISYIMLEHL